MSITVETDHPRGGVHVTLLTCQSALLSTGVETTVCSSNAPTVQAIPRLGSGRPPDTPGPATRLRPWSTWTTVPSAPAVAPTPWRSDVPQGSRRQPRRDRRPSLPGRDRARRPHRRRLPLRGPQERAPAQGGRGLPDRRGGPPGPRLPRPRRDRGEGGRGRCRRDLPGLRLPLGEPAPRRGVRRRRHHLHRAAGIRPAPDRQQGARDRGRPRRGPADPARLGPGHRPRRPRAGRGRDRLPGVRQGRLRRRWTRYAARRDRGDAARVARGRPARGRVGLRRPDALPRGGRGQPAAHRGPGARRQHRRGRPPLRARLLAAAAPPEGRRDRAGPEPRRRDPRPDVRRRRRVRPLDRLRQRGHRRVPPRRGRPLRLHRDEPAHPGRAHGDRGGHRHRPRRHADADRLG